MLRDRQMMYKPFSLSLAVNAPVTKVLFILYVAMTLAASASRGADSDWFSISESAQCLPRFVAAKSHYGPPKLRLYCIINIVGVF